MKCNFHHTNAQVLARRRQRGFALIENLFGLMLLGLLSATLVGFFMFTSQGLAGLYNYVELDDKNRVAIDYMTRDIRTAAKLKEFTPEKIVIETRDGKFVTYEYDQQNQRLMRDDNGTSRKVMLTGCDRFHFAVEYSLINAGEYDGQPATDPSTATVVDVSWHAYRTAAGRINTESVQTAKIVIRNMALQSYKNMDWSMWGY